MGTAAVRRTYVITGVNDPRRVCRAVFDVLGDDVETVAVDAYSDYAGQMPDDIRRAEAWLRELGLLTDRRDPAEAICIPRTDDIGWEIARAYALWATHVRLHDRRRSALAVIDDGGRAATVELTTDQAARLADHIGEAATMTELASGTR